MTSYENKKKTFSNYRNFFDTPLILLKSHKKKCPIFQSIKIPIIILVLLLLLYFIFALFEFNSYVPLTKVCI
jgi:hypothetical protein